MAWQENSIMASKGVAKGKPGIHHVITEADQGKYHYVYGPYVKPVLTVEPGAVVSAETHDAFEGAIKYETDIPSKILNFPFLNPQNGPMWINGAEKGDTLAVYIESIVPRGPQPRGTTVIMPEFGGLVGTGQTALLNPALPERVKKLEITLETGTKWNDKITLPYEPFIGTIGTSPEIEAISSLVPDYYGGNMDLPDVGVGAVVYLPVSTKGALLYLGDCHAAQGDGELCGVAASLRLVFAIHPRTRKQVHGPLWVGDHPVVAAQGHHPGLKVDAQVGCDWNRAGAGREDIRL